MDANPIEERSEADEPRLRSKQIAQEFVDDVRHDWWVRSIAWIKRNILRWQVLGDRSKSDHA